jgi:hypothetical protein
VKRGKSQSPERAEECFVPQRLTPEAQANAENRYSFS